MYFRNPGISNNPHAMDNQQDTKGVLRRIYRISSLFALQSIIFLSGYFGILVLFSMTHDPLN
jgi:hypothetical protein